MSTTKSSSVKKGGVQAALRAPNEYQEIPADPNPPTKLSSLLAPTDNSHCPVSPENIVHHIGSYGDITEEIRWITPEFAHSALCNLHPRQRNLVRSTVAQRRTDLRTGRFMLTPDPVIFSPSGMLMNGRNRLTALVEEAAENPAVTGMPMKVVYNYPDTTMGYIDTGVRRSHYDTARGLGIECDKRMLEMAPWVQYGAFGVAEPRKLTTVLGRIEAVALHREAMQFALDHTKGNVTRIYDPTLRAVLARAWYTVKDTERLAFFPKVLANPEIREDVKEDWAAIQWRKILLDPRLIAAGVQIHPMVRYKKAEYALYLFLERKESRAIFEAARELFPIPGERTFTPEEVGGPRDPENGACAAAGRGAKIGPRKTTVENVRGRQQHAAG